MKNKNLTSTYILQTNRENFYHNEVSPVCQLCKEDNEAQQPNLKDFLCVLNELIEKHPVSAEYTLIQLLVDGDFVIQNNQIILKLCELTTLL